MLRMDLSMWNGWLLCRYPPGFLPLIDIVFLRCMGPFNRARRSYCPFSDSISLLHYIEISVSVMIARVASSVLANAESMTVSLIRDSHDCKYDLQKVLMEVNMKILDHVRLQVTSR